jgi:glycosyltransferase involved in cell wall biosynthesis
MDPTRESMPKVSVIMSVFNGEPYLSQAIESILSQTFRDFEFIIVDDGSTDGSPEILKERARQDARIRLIRNDSNLGLIVSLNEGIRVAKGEYVARQDADDISLLKRLALQVQFLDENPEIGVLGTWMTNVDENGRQVVWKTSTSHAVIRWSLLFDTSIAHATVMMRRSLFEGDTPFRPEMLHAEDYDLWSRLSEKSKLANLPECLYLRRLHERRVTVRHQEKQEETVKAVMYENIRKVLGQEPNVTLVKNLRNAFCGELLESGVELRAMVELIVKLYRTYTAQNSLDAVERKEVAYDATCILTRIGLKHVGRWPREATGILWEAIRLSRRIPFNTYMAVPLKLLTKS